MMFWIAFVNVCVDSSKRFKYRTLFISLIFYVSYTCDLKKSNTLSKLKTSCDLKSPDYDIYLSTFLSRGELIDNTTSPYLYLILKFIYNNFTT